MDADHRRGHDLFRRERPDRSVGDPEAAKFFVAWIVFHEMLHAVVPDERLNGKTYKHTRTFRRLENAFPNVKDMRRFCRVLLHLLA